MKTPTLLIVGILPFLPCCKREVHEQAPDLGNDEAGGNGGLSFVQYPEDDPRSKWVENHDPVAKEREVRELFQHIADLELPEGTGRFGVDVVTGTVNAPLDNAKRRPRSVFRGGVAG